MFCRCVLIGLLFLSFGRSFSQNESDSITIAIAPEYDDVSGMHRFFFGKSYRKLWAAPVKLRVLRLEKEKGGLTIVQKGGGLQTKSLRLKDSSGKEWVLRSVQKYPERALPPKLKATIVKDILQDQVVTSHPYAALTVPPFAKTLGIFHTNPEIVYLSDGPALGDYRLEFGNSVLLFEEREPDDAPDTDNTEKTIKAVQKDNDTRIDQKKVLRARLLDVFLGDWDRHEDQWRWLEIKTDSQHIYEPFPRDRDKVYYTTSGLFPKYLSYQYLKSNLQRFKGTIRSVNTYNYNNRYFDRNFLNELNKSDWEAEVKEVQSLLTDSLIYSAIQLLPNTIYQLSGKKIIQILIERRNNLDKIALEYFAHLSKFADLPGTDKHELFEVKHLPDGLVALSLYKIKKDKTREQLLYQRTFDPAHTKEIRLYGLDGNDVFSVSGEHHSSIKIHMVGGPGVDSFDIGREVRSKKKLFVYDRSDEENIFTTTSGARMKLSTDSAVNSYDRHNFKFEKLRPLFLMYYNRDQGFSLRTGIVHERQGFRREPYANKNLLVASYSAGWKSFSVGFQSEFKKLFRGNDLTLNLIYRGPNNLVNFFGIGNETPFSNKDERGLYFFRNQYNLSEGDIQIRRQLGRFWNLHGGLTLQYYAVSPSKNTGRYLTVYNVQEPSEDVFSDRLFSGFVAGIGFNKRKGFILPTKGLYWNMQVNGIRQIVKGIRNIGQLQSELGFYIPLTRDSTLIIASRVGGGATIGEPMFFQQLYLGGAQNLRGYAVNRFAGNHMLYQTVEMRIKLFDFAAYLFPGTIGLIGFYDIGRVWVKNDSSEIWHKGYGGGVYLIPADAVLIQASAAWSEEGMQPYVSIGFNF